MAGWIDPDNYGKHSRQFLGHSFRYYLASGFLDPYWTVIDAACGVGYGSAILSRFCGTVFGFDNDEGALEIARRKHIYDNVEYYNIDLSNDSDLFSAEAAVSFETIEHLDDPQFFINSVKRAARKLIILSAPVIPTVGVNPHHKHDFTERELLDLVLDEEWILWEHIRQGPYCIVVAYKGSPV